MLDALPARGMDRRSNEAHPGDCLGFGLDVVGRQQVCLREPLGQIDQDAGDLGERSMLEYRPWRAVD
jgi:hypothetical protein